MVLAEQRIGTFWTLTQSQVYRELATMEEAGLVEVGEPGPRKRKPYTVTGAGRAAFAEWVEQDPAGEQVRFPLLLTMVFAQHLSVERFEEIVAAHRAEHQRRLATYEQQEQAMREAPAADPFQRVTLEFGLQYERAVLAWFDRLPALLAR